MSNVVELFKRPVTKLVNQVVPIKNKLESLEGHIDEWGKANGLDPESKAFIYASKIARMAFASLMDKDKELVENAV